MRMVVQKKVCVIAVRRSMLKPTTSIVVADVPTMRAGRRARDIDIQASAAVAEIEEDSEGVVARTRNRCRVGESWKLYRPMLSRLNSDSAAVMMQMMLKVEFSFAVATENSTNITVVTVLVNPAACPSIRNIRLRGVEDGEGSFISSVE